MVSDQCCKYINITCCNMLEVAATTPANAGAEMTPVKAGASNKLS